MKYTVIGSGFSGLSTAAYLAKKDTKFMFLKKMTLLEVEQGNLKPKDTHLIWVQVGIDADVFDKFFKDFDKNPKDYYDLIELNPGFQIIFRSTYS